MSVLAPAPTTMDEDDVQRQLQMRKCVNDAMVDGAKSAAMFGTAWTLAFVGVYKYSPKIRRCVLQHFACFCGLGCGDGPPPLLWLRA